MKRYVHSIFSDKYHSTIGVKIDRKDVVVDQSSVKLAIWDLNGEERFERLSSSYLRAMRGFLLVVDGTRPETVGAAEDLMVGALKTVPGVPFVTCFNKVDLLSDWQVDDAAFAQRHSDKNCQCLRTSAKMDAEVENAFSILCRKMLDALET